MLTPQAQIGRQEARLLSAEAANEHSVLKGQLSRTRASYMHKPTSDARKIELDQPDCEEDDDPLINQQASILVALPAALHARLTMPE